MYNNFISQSRKKILSQLLNLSDRQIKIWFQNRRAKERRQRKPFQSLKDASETETTQTTQETTVPDVEALATSSSDQSLEATSTPDSSFDSTQHFLSLPLKTITHSNSDDPTQYSL